MLRFTDEQLETEGFPKENYEYILGTVIAMLLPAVARIVLTGEKGLEVQRMIKADTVAMKDEWAENSIKTGVALRRESQAEHKDGVRSSRKGSRRKDLLPASVEDESNENPLAGEGAV